MVASDSMLKIARPGLVGDNVGDETRYGTKEVEIIDYGIVNRDDQPVTLLESGRDYRIFFILNSINRCPT